MFAVLGDISFQLATSFDAFDGTFGSDFAEQARISNKPGLQFVGAKLDEYHITVLFHQQYCSPDAQFKKLMAACQAHQALAFVLGNGDYKGWFVITDIAGSYQLNGQDGAAQAISVDLTLREFAGDPASPMTPPGVRTSLPSLSQGKAGALPGAGIGGMVRSAVRYARQAQSALQTASNVVRVARQMKSNPVAAFTRVPGVLGSLGNVAAPLAQSVPWLNQLTGQLPETIPLVRAAGEVAVMVNGARETLGGVRPGDNKNLPGALDTVAGLVGSAVTTWNNQSPQLSRLASRIITRSL